MSDDYTREALEEIARRRKALKSARERAVVDRRAAEARDFFAENPVVSAVLVQYLDRFESLRLQERVAFGWRPVPDAVMVSIFKLAALKLAELETAEDPA